MRSAAAAIALLALAAASLSGCYGSSSESSSGAERPKPSTAPAGASARNCPPGASGVQRLRATGVDCAQARLVASGWRRAKECDKHGSRSGCSLLSYRCLATATDRGWSVSCAKPDRSIAFVARPG